MTEQDSKSDEDKRRFDPRLLKKGLRCDLDQYEFLKQCSEKGDEGITEWNDWRKVQIEEKVFLEGAIFCKVNLEGADFRWAYLKNSDFVLSHLEGANFDMTRIQIATFNFAFVNSKTSFIGCRVDRGTDFRGVSLNTIRIKPETKQLLEYNIRRMNWEDWYKKHPISKLIWKNFWCVSNYGLSEKRILITFVGLAIVFATIYYLWGRIAPPGIVDYLFVDGNGVEVAWWLVPIRAIHFSVVVMTVGFTNMHANAHSFWAHILVSLQMILGFVLLGALVTRFAVLFTAGGPAGRFADEKEKMVKIS